jgi:uncharacterized protein involved in exopolysaccharide biosynthesis
MMSSETSLQTSLLDMLRILFGRKWSVVVIISAAVLSALVYRLLIRGESYELQGKVLVKIGREQAPPAMIFGDRPMVVGYREQDVNSEIGILGSREVLERVVDKLRLDLPSVEEPPQGWIARLRFEAKGLVRRIKNAQKELMIWIGLAERLTPREEAVFLLSQSLKVEPMTESNILVVRQQTPVRKGSSTLLNTLLDCYVEFRVEAFRDPSAVDFLTEQCEQSRRQLEEQEKRLHDFEAENQIVAIDKQLEETMRQSEIAQSQLTEAGILLADASLKLEKFRSSAPLTQVPFASLGEFDERSYPETLQKQLTELELERIRLMLTESSDGRISQNNRQQFDTLTGLISSHLQAVLDERRAEAELRSETLREWKRKEKSLHEARATWHELDRDVRLKEESYALFAKKLEEAKATASLDKARVGNVAIVERAFDPIIPSGPRLSIFLGVALALGVLASLAWVSLLEFFDHRVHTEEVLHRNLSAPVLAVVPFDRGRAS